VAANGPVIGVRGWLDSPTYVLFQRLVLTVEVSIAPGFHVCGHPAEAGLLPLSVGIDAIEGLDDGLWVHEGVVRGTVPLTFAAAPGGGDHQLGITVHVQAGDGATCLAPASIRLRIPVREAALVGRSL
jgi:hypothetical protein